jgi:hypothetical protein
MGEDEVARDEVMRSSSVGAGPRQDPEGNRLSRWKRRAPGSLRRRARDVPSGRRREMSDGHLHGSAANRGRQWRAQRSCASPLHAGLAVRVDAAMAPACGRNRGHAT